MRGGRSLLVLLLVALGVAAYAYFVEMKRDTTPAAMKKERIFTMESGKIEEIELHAENGDVTKLKKAGETWQIVEPAPLDVDVPAVNALVSTLDTIEAQRIVDENPASVKNYGLEPPRYYILFQLAGETTPRRLNVGMKTPTGADMYARAEGATRLVLISSFLEDMLNRSTFQLREKAILKVTQPDVDSLTLEVPGSPTLQFAKKAGDWRITSPINAKADMGSTEGLVGRVTQSMMTSVVTSEAPSPADLKKYGLDKPQLSLTIGAGSTRGTLDVGGKKDADALYARDRSRPLVFTVETKLLDDLKRKLDDVRAKDVFEFRSFTLAGLEITHAGKTYVFGKQKPDAAANQTPIGEIWKLVKPEAKDIDQPKFNELVGLISNLRADKFADKPPSAGEDVVVLARHGDPSSLKEERVTLRKSGATVHAIRPGDPGAAVVNATDFDKAIGVFKELVGVK